MNVRTRKFVGAIALLVFLTVYVLLAMAVAIILQVRGVAGIGETLYYVLAGLVWVVPAGIIVRWMQKEPPSVGQQR